jgi:hypothetical protein
MKRKELQKIISDDRIESIYAIKEIIRQFRCLIADARVCTHTISKDALYSRAATIMHNNFNGHSLMTGCDFLKFPQTKDNKMLHYPTPDLKGI